MATVSERVHVMKENFMTWHNQGFSIPEIAEMSHLSFNSVYNHLQEIAYENGVTRESLLQIVRTQKSPKAWKDEEKRVRIDTLSMAEDFKKAAETVNSLISQIDKVIEEERL